MGMEISIRFLAVLEDLVKDPGVGIAYKVFEGDLAHGGVLKVLEANKVSGIFSAILMKYQEKCDWTPLYELKQELAQAQIHLGGARGLLKGAREVLNQAPNVDQQRAGRFAQMIDEYLTQLGAPRPDPSGS